MSNHNSTQQSVNHVHYSCDTLCLLTPDEVDGNTCCSSWWWWSNRIMWGSMVWCLMSWILITGTTFCLSNIMIFAVTKMFRYCQQTKPQCTCPISRIISFVTKNAHLCPEWCIVGCGTGALRDLRDWSIHWRGLREINAMFGPDMITSWNGNAFRITGPLAQGCCQ